MTSIDDPNPSPSTAPAAIDPPRADRDTEPPGPARPLTPLGALLMGAERHSAAETVPGSVMLAEWVAQLNGPARRAVYREPDGSYIGIEATVDDVTRSSHPTLGAALMALRLHYGDTRILRAGLLDAEERDVQAWMAGS